MVELLHKFDVPGDRPVLLLIDQFEELFRFREAARRLAGQARDTWATAGAGRSASLAAVHRQRELPLAIAVDRAPCHDAPLALRTMSS